MSAQDSGERIFHQAIEIDSPAHRDAFLKGACGEDTELRRRLDNLLRAHDAAGGFLNVNTTEKVPTLHSENPLTEGPGTVIDRYKLLEKLGEGGFGAVYVAEQREPVKRRVALKIIKLGMNTKHVVARFEAEQQALALMNHPNIAKVLDAGATESSHPVSDYPLPSDGRGVGGEGRPHLSAGRPYFVMELVRGIPITKYCDQEKLDTQARLDLFIKVCHAIQHAHQKGIIHRDIKPSNILVTLHDGVPVPKVIDFGIAKATQGELTDKTVYTQFQQFIGTPAYMSPEQAEMSGLDIDTRSDIYSLGALLYELLTGSTPFDTKELMQSGLDEMRKIIREREPVRPSTRLTQMRLPAESPIRNPKSKIENDLDWIVMKCLEKDRTRRYETANGLAMDIQRHLKNERVVAGPPSNLYRLRKLVRRNKAVFAGVATAMAALVIGLAVATVSFLRERDAHHRAVAAEREQRRLRKSAETAQQNEQVQRQRAEAHGLSARRSLYGADMVIAQQALDRGNLGHCIELLEKHRPQDGTEDLRGWEWRYLWRHSRGDEIMTLGRHSNVVVCVAFSPDGRWLASHGQDRKIKIGDIPRRQPCATLECPTPSPIYQCRSLSFSPEGSRLAGANGRFGAIIWDTDQWIELERFGGSPSNSVSAIAYSPDGRLLVKLWNLETKSENARFNLSYASLDTSAFSADGSLLALGYLPPDSADAFISLRDVRDGRERAAFRAHQQWISGLAFSPDGRTLASSSLDSTAKLWNLGDLREPAAVLKGRLLSMNSITISPDGRRLAAGSDSGEIRLWDMTTRQEVGVLKGHDSFVNMLSFVDDDTLVSASAYGNNLKEIFLWRASSWAEIEAAESKEKESTKPQ